MYGIDDDGGDDITVSQRLVTLGRGTSQTQVIITVKEDNEAEQEEKVTITLQLDGGQDSIPVAIDENNKAVTITIPASDTPTVNYAKTAVSITEDNSQDITINVKPTPMEDLVLDLSFESGGALDKAEIEYPSSVTVKLGQGSTQITITITDDDNCLLYTSPSPRDRQKSRMPSSA